MSENRLVDLAQSLRGLFDNALRALEAKMLGSRIKGGRVPLEDLAVWRCFEAERCFRATKVSGVDRLIRIGA